MNVLVMYSTIEGQTEKIAKFIADRIGNQGNEVSLTQTSDPGYCDPGTFDAAILCAPVHISRYPSDFVDYVQNWKSSLVAVRNAFVSVSLAIASKNANERQEAQEYVDTLTKKTGWKPDVVHHAAGALKYLEYDFFKRWMMRRISEGEGGPTDTSVDHELTDWAALGRFCDEFIETNVNA